MTIMSGQHRPRFNAHEVFMLTRALEAAIDARLAETDTANTDMGVDMAADQAAEYAEIQDRMVRLIQPDNTADIIKRAAISRIDTARTRGHQRITR